MQKKNRDEDAAVEIMEGFLAHISTLSRDLEGERKALKSLEQRVLQLEEGGRGCMCQVRAAKGRRQ